MDLEVEIALALFERTGGQADGFGETERLTGKLRLREEALITKSMRRRQARRIGLSEGGLTIFARQRLKSI
jgi:hypothetical protein